VLFADLKGSMELLADRDPEDARKLLDPVLERMMDAVHRYEGTVNQVMGDGIMALFGAPVAHEDHAVRACYAAFDMQMAIRRYAEEVRRSQGIGGVRIRVGLNSGEVVVRAIGSDLRMDYTAVGQTTHLAARMEQLADPGTIVLTADTLRLAEGYVEVKPLGPLSIRGLGTPLDVYEMVGAGPRRSRLHAAAARGLTRFVGRETELEQLRQALERAVRGHGQVVAIVGEPGVGKSRLVWEVTHSHRTHGWLILQAGSVSYGKATAYLPVIGLLKDYFQIADQDDPRKVREKVTGKLLTLDETLKPTLSAFLALLDVPAEDLEWQALDPLQRRQRTLDALKRLLLLESRVQPLLLVFEDLHWIDTETQALLDSLAEGVPTARVLLLVNYRPEYQHGWGRKTYYSQLRLDALPPESAEELLHALLGGDGQLQPLKQLLVQLTEGNPFFLEESVRTLMETGVLAGERGAYRLTKPLQSIQVPVTVQSFLAARIDRLPSEEKTLLQAAAVIGKDVPHMLLQAIAQFHEEDLRRALAHLQTTEFLYEASLFPELAYTFKHALTHEVAYGSLLHERRRTLHTRIVEAIERLYPDRLAEHVERLAHHAIRGELWGKAVGYLRQAGAKAFARSANWEAATCFEQALAALAHLPETRDTLERRIDLRFYLSNAFWPLDEMRKAFEQIRDAEAVARALSDPRWVARVLSTMTHYLFLMGDHNRASETGGRALALAETLGDSALRVRTTCFLALNYLVLGDYHRAIEFARRNVLSLEGDLSLKRFAMVGLPSVWDRGWLGLSLAELGEFPEALVRMEEAMRIAEKSGDSVALIVSHTCAGFIYLVRGHPDRSARTLERGLSLYAANVRFLFSAAAALLGHAYALSGRIPEGLPLLEQAVEQVELSGFTNWYSRPEVRLGEAYLLAGRVEDALRLAHRALALSRTHKQRGHEAHALRLFGEIASQRDAPDLDEGETRYRQAMTLATELGLFGLTVSDSTLLGIIVLAAG